MILKWLFDRIVAFFRFVIALANIVRSDNNGKGKDAWWSCFLCSETRGNGWQVV